MEMRSSIDLYYNHILNYYNVINKVLYEVECARSTNVLSRSLKIVVIYNT